jgi:hypothetical protein
MIPVLDTPTFDVDVYSLNKKVQMRPFLVKEEKILIMAQESGKKEDMMKAMQDIVSVCSQGALVGKDLPFFDLQNIFLRLRSQSIGGTSEFNLICGECQHRTPFEMDLESIQLVTNEEHTNKIQLTDDIGVVMRYPSGEELGNEESKVFDIVVSCIDSIYTKEEIHSTKDETKEDIEAWVENLTSDQFEKIAKFFETSPRLEKTIEYKCSKCETENVVVMDGLESFFG